MKLDKMELEEFGQWLAAQRKLNAFSQAQMARMLSVNPPYIHKVEKGLVTPSNDYVVKMTVVFDIKPADVAAFVGYLHEKQMMRLIKKGAA